MSHTVTITRTTTTSSGSMLYVNTGYLRTTPGLLKLAELILGAICVGLVLYYWDHNYAFRYGGQKAELFFLLMAVTFLIGTFCLLLSCLISLSTSSIMSKTIYEVIYHGLAFILYLAASITLLVEVNHRKNNYYSNYYEQFLVASVLGLVVSGLYLLSTVFANRTYRELPVGSIPVSCFAANKQLVYDKMARGSTIVRVAPGGSGGNGIKCCCCRCFECINFGYLTSQHGLIKLAEAMLGGLCQSLLVKYGMTEASTMGSAFHGFLTTASACLLSTSLLIACYVLSANSQHLIRQSIYECLFNAAACFMYLSASSYLGVAVTLYMMPQHVILNTQAAYPALTAVYYIGVVVGILHGVDAYIAYKYRKGYR